MERKPLGGTGTPGTSKGKTSNISVNNNARRSTSKSPVRPRTPTNPTPKSPGQNSNAQNPGPSNKNPNGSAKMSAVNVAASSVEGAKKIYTNQSVLNAGTKSTVENSEATASTSSNTNANSNTVAAAPPVSTVSKVSTSAKSTTSGQYGGLNPYRNSMSMSRTFPRPMSQNQALIYTRGALARSTVALGAKGPSSAAFRAAVEKAVREHKIYTVVGMYPAVRSALKRRGWIEKNFNNHLAMKAIQSQNRDSEPARGSEEESDQAWLVRVLKDYPPDFIWVIRRDNIEWRLLHKDQLINRYPKAFFTTKVGIAACLQNIHWYSEPGVAEILFPRCYRLCLDEERQAFIDDFRLTACFGLLKLFVLVFERDGETGFHDHNTRMSTVNVEFAIRQVNNYIKMRRHEDIDWVIPTPLTANHWEAFLLGYYDIATGRTKFNWKDATEGLRHKVEQVRRINQRAAIYWPQYHIDGNASLWICKPGARSRGKGIVIMSQLDKIMELLTTSNFREANWVVQKYIERPLLVYKTKFDIRQWFIITDWSPLTIWFYKESYIRFCTKPFTLVDFHESVHLCNNAVQCRYTNSELRDNALPEENMWDCYTFQAYLNTIGKMDAWEKTVYPGMKHAIIGVLLASQETVESRKNCFELYGADFMLSEDLKPWLIEINSCPCMASSTSVTGRLCPSCLEDTIKVVLDRKEDKNCDTGYFEMIYKQNISGMNTTLYGGSDLILQGRKMTRDIDWPGIMTKYNTSSRGSPKLLNHLTARSLTESESTSEHFKGMTFVDLVERLRLREDENHTTPHAQRSIDNSPGSSLHAAIRKYRMGQGSQSYRQIIPSSSHAPVNMPPNNSSDNEPLRGPTPNLDTSGILNVKKLQTGPPDPVILYNGVPNTNNSNSNGKHGSVSYSEMYPLYSQLSNTNKPQNFVTFGNRSAQNKSVYGFGINSNVPSGSGFGYNANIASGTGFGINSSNPSGSGFGITNASLAGMPGTSKPTIYANNYAPLSLLTGQPTPGSATMAELFRQASNGINQGPYGLQQQMQNSVYGHLTGLQQQGKGGSNNPTPMMLINPMKTKSLKIRPGPSNRSTQVSPMRVPNPPPGWNGTKTSDGGNTQKYGKIWTHYKVKKNANLCQNDKVKCKTKKMSKSKKSKSSNSSASTMTITSPCYNKYKIGIQCKNVTMISDYKNRANNHELCKNCSPATDRSSTVSGRQSTGSVNESSGQEKRPTTEPILTPSTQSQIQITPNYSNNTSGEESIMSETPINPPPKILSKSAIQVINYQPPPSETNLRSESSTKIKPKVIMSNHLLKNETKINDTRMSEANIDFIRVATAKDSVTLMFSKFSPAYMIYPSTPTHSNLQFEIDDDDDKESENNDKNENVEKEIGEESESGNYPTISTDSQPHFESDNTRNNGEQENSKEEQNENVQKETEEKVENKIEDTNISSSENSTQLSSDQQKEESKMELISITDFASYLQPHLPSPIQEDNEEIEDTFLA